MTDQITMGSRRGRLILLACVLSSGAVFLDGTVVNIALFRLGDDLDAGFSTLQWVIDAYLLALCALVLIGGSLGDLFGRLARHLAPDATVAVATGVFVLCHAERGLLQPVSVLPLGVALGLMRLWTGSLWPCIALHAASNGAVVLARVWSTG